MRGFNTPYRKSRTLHTRGLAPLFSTVLMLAIPAKIAGCEKIVLASPAKINDAVLFVLSFAAWMKFIKWVVQEP